MGPGPVECRFTWAGRVRSANLTLPNTPFGQAGRRPGDRSEADWLSNVDEVRLVVPAGPEFVRLARVTATSLASRLGFSYDEIEDLRLAVDELCHAVIGPSGRAGTVSLLYITESDGLSVEGTGHFDPVGPPVALSETTRQILSALTDDHNLRDEDDGTPTVWFRKLRAGRHGT